MAMGFIGKDEIVHSVDKFSKLQNEIIRRQNRELKDASSKINLVEKFLSEGRVMGMKCKSGLGVLRGEKDRMTATNYDNVYNVLAAATTLLTTNGDAIRRHLQRKSEGAMQHPLKVDPEPATSTYLGDEDLPFNVIERKDVVAKFVGNTAAQTTAVMEKCFGGVAFFDEAYSLCNDSPGMKDSYGHTALSVINDYMEKHNDKIIVVFAGYEKEIKQQLFTAQPGLPSRFSQTFRIEPYTSEQLLKILILELDKLKLKLNATDEMIEYFNKHHSLFINTGRDMRSIASYIYQQYSENSYHHLIDGHEEKMNWTIDSLDYFIKAIDRFKDYRMKPEEQKQNPFDMLTKAIGAEKI
jgi:hypothetical protein